MFNCLYLIISADDCSIRTIDYSVEFFEQYANKCSYARREKYAKGEVREKHMRMTAKFFSVFSKCEKLENCYGHKRMKGEEIDGR